MAHILLLFAKYGSYKLLEGIAGKSE